MFAIAPIETESAPPGRKPFAAGCCDDAGAATGWIEITTGLCVAGFCTVDADSLLAFSGGAPFADAAANAAVSFGTEVAAGIESGFATVLSAGFALATGIASVPGVDVA
jgi:hypothetical protein